MAHNFETKKMIVEKGDSKIFNNWNEFCGVSKEDFLRELEWLCEDPLTESGKLTRELGCLADGTLVRLFRAYDNGGCFSGFYFKNTGRIWYGKAGLSARDRV